MDRQRLKFRLGLVLMALSPDPVAAFEELLGKSLRRAHAEIVPVEDDLTAYRRRVRGR